MFFGFLFGSLFWKVPQQQKNVKFDCVKGFKFFRYPTRKLPKVSDFAFLVFKAPSHEEEEDTGLGRAERAKPNVPFFWVKTGISLCLSLSF